MDAEPAVNSEKTEKVAVTVTVTTDQPANAAALVASAPIATNSLSDALAGADFSVLLRIFYERLFPYGPYFQWLSYGGNEVAKNYFLHREFSFTLKDDTYIRFQSFADQAELEKEIRAANPYKIDIGAVYNSKPKDRKAIKAQNFKPEEKELVFDVDMTDYDEVRTCCKGADICKKCWRFMTIAVLVVDSCLHEDFGFEHRLWVYSGRRGVHCWVCDKSARALSQDGRVAIAEYLSVIKGGDSKVKKVHLNSLHPSLDRAAKIIEPLFLDYIANEQHIFGSTESREKVLELIPDDGIQTAIRDKWDRERLLDSDPAEKYWSILTQVTRSNKKKYLEHEIMFQFAYPRLDVAVSKGLNHLLKSPFCVHPKTGRVCVPFDPLLAEEFNPFNVPTLAALVGEIDAYHAKHKNDAAKLSLENVYDMTSLGAYCKFFTESFLAPMIEKQRIEIRKLNQAKKDENEVVELGVGFAR